MMYVMIYFLKRENNNQKKKRIRKNKQRRHASENVLKEIKVCESRHVKRKRCNNQHDGLPTYSSGNKTHVLKNQGYPIDFTDKQT